MRTRFKPSSHNPKNSLGMGSAGRCSRMRDGSQAERAPRATAWHRQGSKSQDLRRGGDSGEISFAAFTLLEVLVAMALMAVIIPVVYQALHVASLAGEVSERKALAARIGENALNEAIIGNPSQFARAGNEQAGPFHFHWTLKDEGWEELNKVSSITTPNGINQTGVNQTVIHQYSVDVTFAAQGKDYTVRVSTLVNVTPQ